MAYRARLFATSLSAALLGLATPAVPAETKAPPETFITDEGYGDIKVGMSRDDVLKLLGDGWKYESFPEGTDDISGVVCGYIFKTDDTGAVSFMTEGGKIVRAEARNESIKTEKGIHIGSTEEDVRKAYGDAVVAGPHQYQAAPAQYLTVWTKGAPAKPEDYVDSPDARGIRFSTGEDKKVQDLFGGGSAIQYVEGCA